MKRRAQTIVLVVALVVGVAVSMVAHRLVRPAEDGWPGGGAGAERVILFAPNLIEAAWALGHGRQVVAVTDYCVWPPEAAALPRVGGAVDPNLERIVGLRPSLLVVQGENRVLPRLGRQMGIPVVRVDMDRDLSSIFRGLARLDSLLGDRVRPGAAVLITRIRSRLDALRERTAEGPHPRVLLSLGHDPSGLGGLWTVGAGSFLSELLEIAGGRPYEDSAQAGYRPLGVERVLADPPDVVLELRPSEQLDAQEEASIRAVWRRAGVTAPVEFVCFDGLLIPGPRIDRSARALHEALTRAREGRAQEEAASARRGSARSTDEEGER